MIKPLGRKQFIVGTAQLGLPCYGVANASGRPASDQAVDLLQSAFEAGVGGVDCAPAYGLAEEIVGQALRDTTRDLSIVTKLFPVDETQPPYLDLAVEIRESVRFSRELLGLEKLPVFLLHDWRHRSMNGGAVWETLLELREAGLIGRLGASAHSPSEAAEAVADPDVQHLQMPCNLLDDRWESVLPALAERTDLTVHVRSAFLQGVFFLPPHRWPHTLEAQAAELQGKIKTLTHVHGRKNVQDFALAWARSQPWVHGVVTGMEAETQLAENLELFDTPLLDPDTLSDIRRELAGAPSLLLDPSTWSA